MTDAIIVNFNTPAELSPNYHGETYDMYFNTLSEFVKIAKPQYIATDGNYIKLMCWCAFEDLVDG